ncbi:hypothetical protein Bbelb_280210 [Branchiostoma belcheri]|nr:hypothetical protein Bbelb_280210 [Branchiostoma belcheri]
MRLPAMHMLFLLVLVSNCVASETLCPPQCREASRPQDLPTDIRLNQQGLTSMGDIPLNSWLVCNGLNRTTGTSVSIPTTSIPCIDVSKSTVAIIGYPFGVLLKRTLASYSRITILALVKGQISDIEDNALTGLVTMGRLDLTYNRLVHVKQGWFFGLTFLISLALSGNQIIQMEPGCFNGLANLHYLYLNDNLLRNVEPGWFTGLNKLNELNLESNCIEVIASGTFKQLTQLYRLSLAGNSLSHLDGGTFWRLNSLIFLGTIGARSDTVPDTIAHDMAWSLALGNSDGFFKGEEVSVKVSNGLLCVINDYSNNEQTLMWTLDSPRIADFHTAQYHVEPCSRGVHSQQITSQAPFVVMIQRGSLNPHIDRCRQAWEAAGITLALHGGGLNLQLVSILEGNAETEETVAIVFDQAQMSNVESEDRNTVTCFLLMTDSSSRLVFEVYGSKSMLNKTPRRWTDVPTNTRTIDCVARTTDYVARTTDHVLRTTEHIVMATDHVLRATDRDRTTDGDSWTTTDHTDIDDTITGHCLLRDDEIPDEAVSAAQRPLPALPHTYWEIPDDGIPGVARPTSLPFINNLIVSPRSGSKNVQASCRSLPASLRDIEPTYGEIPERDDDRLLFYAAATDLTLPVVRHKGERRKTCIYHDGVVRQKKERRKTCIYHDGIGTTRKCTPGIHDRMYGRSIADKSNRVTFYRTLTVEGASLNQSMAAHRTREDAALVSSRDDQDMRSYINTRNVPERYLMPTTDGCMSHSMEDIPRRTCNSLWQTVGDSRCKMQHAWSQPALPTSREICQREVSFVRTLPNTYRSWRTVEDNMYSRQQSRSLPVLFTDSSVDEVSQKSEAICTLPNTYWLGEVRGGRNRSIVRRASLPSLPTSMSEKPTQNEVETVHTLPNTYWSWEIDSSGQLDRSRPVPPVTIPPNTYWLWHI